MGCTDEFPMVASQHFVQMPLHSNRSALSSSGSQLLSMALHTRDGHVRAASVMSNRGFRRCQHSTIFEKSTTRACNSHRLSHQQQGSRQQQQSQCPCPCPCQPRKKHMLHFVTTSNLCVRPRLVSPSATATPSPLSQALVEAFIMFSEGMLLWRGHRMDANDQKREKPKRVVKNCGARLVFSR